jgi:predicted amidophosphoribosyltransferase
MKKIKDLTKDELLSFIFINFPIYPSDKIVCSYCEPKHKNNNLEYICDSCEKKLQEEYIHTNAEPPTFEISPEMKEKLAQQWDG